MNLSKAERQLLVNQCEILKRLEPGSERHYDEIIEILYSGYELFYDQAVAVDDAMPADDSRFVLDVLSMYRVLEAFYRDNPETPALQKYNARYRGFDGNNETKFYAFSEFLIDTQGKFSEQKDNPEFSNNSHAEVIDRYRAMVDVWHGLPKKHELTEEQVMQILDVS